MPHFPEALAYLTTSWFMVVSHSAWLINPRSNSGPRSPAAIRVFAELLSSLFKLEAETVDVLQSLCRIVWYPVIVTSLGHALDLLIVVYSDDFSVMSRLPVLLSMC